jgi:hypothetical protein
MGSARTRPVKRRGRESDEAHPCVEPVGPEVGQVLRAEVLEAAKARPPEPEAEQAADEREEERLRHEEPRELEAPGAEDLPHRELLGPRRGADEEQVGEVDGADQEEEEDPGLEQEEHRARLGDVVLVEVGDGGVEPGVDDELGVGVALKAVLVHRVDLGLGLGDRRPRAKPGDHLHVVAVALGGFPVVVADRQRGPDLRLVVSKAEAGGHDADYGVGRAVHADLFPDDAGIRGVVLPPEGVAEDDHVIPFPGRPPPP